MRRSLIAGVVSLAVLVGCTGEPDPPPSDAAAEPDEETIAGDEIEESDADPADADPRDELTVPTGPWTDLERTLLEEGATPQRLADRFTLAFGDDDGVGAAPDRPVSVTHSLEVLDVLDELSGDDAEAIVATVSALVDAASAVDVDPNVPPDAASFDDLVGDAMAPFAAAPTWGATMARVSITPTPQPGAPSTEPSPALPVTDDDVRLAALRDAAHLADREIAARWGSEVSGGIRVAVSSSARVDGVFALAQRYWHRITGLDGPCLIVAGRDFFDLPASVAASVVFHEVVHCHQAELPGAGPDLPAWFAEGFAMWAGEWRVGGTPLADGHYVTYLSRAQLPVPSLGYEAIGVWWYLESLGFDPWNLYPRIQELGDPAAALAYLDEVTGGEFSGGWAASRWQESGWGERWVGAPSRYRGGRLPSVGDGGAASVSVFGTVGFGVDLDAVAASDAEVLRITRQGASHLRWVDASLDDSTTDAIVEHWCLSGGCICPDGSAPPFELASAPTSTGLLAVASATRPGTDARMAVQPFTMAELCGCDGGDTRALGNGDARALDGGDARAPDGPPDVATAGPVDVITASFVTALETGDDAPPTPHAVPQVQPVHGLRVPAGPDGPAPAEGDACEPDDSPTDDGATAGSCPAGSYTLDIAYFASAMGALLDGIDVAAVGGRVDADYLDGGFEARVDALTLAAVLPGGVDLPVEIVLDGVFAGTYETDGSQLRFTSSQVDLSTRVTAGGVPMGDVIPLDSGDVAGGLLTASDIECTSAGFTQVPRVEPKIPAVWRSR